VIQPNNSALAQALSQAPTPALPRRIGPAAPAPVGPRVTGPQRINRSQHGDRVFRSAADAKPDRLAVGTAELSNACTRKPQALTKQLRRRNYPCTGWHVPSGTSWSVPGPIYHLRMLKPGPGPQGMSTPPFPPPNGAACLPARHSGGASADQVHLWHFRTRPRLRPSRRITEATPAGAVSIPASSAGVVFHHWAPFVPTGPCWPAG